MTEMEITRQETTDHFDAQMKLVRARPFYWESNGMDSDDDSQALIAQFLQEERTAYEDCLLALSLVEDTDEDINVDVRVVTVTDDNGMMVDDTNTLKRQRTDQDDFSSDKVPRIETETE